MHAGSVVPAAVAGKSSSKQRGRNVMMSLLPALSPRPREAMDTKAEALCQKGHESSSISALIAASRLPPPVGAAALPLPAPPLAPLPPPFGTNWMSAAMTSVECPFLPSLPSQSRKDSLPKTMTVLPFCSHSLAVFAVWPKHKHSYQSVTLLSSLPRFTAIENFTPSDFPLRPSKLNTSGSLPKLPINCTFANPISFPLSAPVGALCFVCMPARRTGRRQWIAILSGDGGSIRLDRIIVGGTEVTLHDKSPIRQESRDLGFLAGVELLADHEGQVLFDGAERLVGGREADVRRLWRSVAIGSGGSGFGRGFPYKTSFCDLPEDYRCWLDWPGRKKPSLLLPGAPLPFRSAPRITAVQAARAIWGTPGATKLTARRTIRKTLVLAGIVFRCSRMKGDPGHWPRSAGPCTAFHAPGSRLPLPRHARRALPQSLTIVPSQPLARFRGFLHPRRLFRRKIGKQEFFSRALIHSPCSHRRIELHD